MQVIIEREFRDRTVISILHRYTYIHYFDRVAVLKSGKLVECGKPSTLLEDTESAFTELYGAVGG
jgi:ABC-type multidrug transport system fused ATPase/permease subunit